MNLMMPLLFGWNTLTLPSGLGLYYALSNIIGMVMQYAYIGGGPVNWRALVGLSQDPVLPRALEQREAQRERYKSLGRSEDDDEEDESEDGADEPQDKPASSRRRRRRRYGRGRR